MYLSVLCIYLLIYLYVHLSIRPSTYPYLSILLHPDGAGTAGAGEGAGEGREGGRGAEAAWAPLFLQNLFA